MRDPYRKPTDSDAGIQPAAASTQNGSTEGGWEAPSGLRDETVRPSYRSRLVEAAQAALRRLDDTRSDRGMRERLPQRTAE
jgi:hypothetical protein